MTRGPKYWITMAAATAVIVVGMILVDLVVRPSEDAIRWIFGVAVALLIADAIATRGSRRGDS
ncbi:MAG: hypothetical protein L0H03_27195 [Rhodococcus sp. (in: high G+C Gram-positive bacteria)]|nr:hypothetical protein [Rhodococcus sp. (in: high G+C Gram-positive bacteria)]